MMLLGVVVAILVLGAFFVVFNEIRQIKVTRNADKYYIDSRHQAVERRMSELERKGSNG